ncbi:MAG: metallophosphoesterase [Aphanocapsa lilacina HA4352-LM1]|jgi:Icc-related predicted phosphoesterase|nr:metallophosphoesterase [Aphanocapsa lilacina HA4352-LM1]
MRVQAVHKQPFHAIPYRAVAPSGEVRNRWFGLSHATVDRLPEGCDAVFACSDLQGIFERAGEEAPRLLGEAVAAELAKLAGGGYLPGAARVGVLLCGDLFVRPQLDRRGGIGDVRPVWRAFARHFRWVAGVAGNHDDFGTAKERAAFLSEPGIYLLDGEVVDLGGLRVAGLGGIIGDPLKPQRRKEKDFVRALKKLVGARPDVMLLHQGPDAPEFKLSGHRAVREVLGRAPVPLVMSGHTHWKEPLATNFRGSQLLNLEGRGLLLQRGVPSLPAGLKLQFSGAHWHLAAEL